MEMDTFCKIYVQNTGQSTRRRRKPWKLAVPLASNNYYIHPSIVRILNIFIAVPCTFKYIHSRWKPRVDFLVTSTTMVKDSALGNSNLINLTMGSNLLPDNGGPKTSSTRMIKNQSRQIFKLIANMCC